MKSPLSLGLLLILLLAGLAPQPARAEGPIQVISEEIENNFPVELLFHIEVEGQEADIKTIKLVYKKRGDISITKDPLEFEPARRVQAGYRWHTEFATIPPGVPVLYYWEIYDQAGNNLATEMRTYYYDDARFAWSTLGDEDLAVFWYDGGDEFGQELYDVCSISLHELKDRLRAELEFPIRVVVYGSREDFYSAFPRMNDWVGGRAFPRMGLTVQIIAPWNHDYLVDVIPHEISHLLFYQLTDNAYVTTPAWLDEGLAVYNEWQDNSLYDDLVLDAAAEGRLLPLAFIIGGFPADYERAILAYAQSYSLVKTLIERFGWEKLGQYLQAYQEAGLRFDEEDAFAQVFGLSFEEFLGDWRESVGAPRAEPSAVPAAESPAVTAEPTSLPAQAGPNQNPPAEAPGSSRWTCLSAALLLTPIATLWWHRREEKDAAAL